MGYRAGMPDEPADPTGDAPDQPDDQRRDGDREEPRGDPDSPGRSLLDDDAEIVEPNEPA